MDLIKVNQSKCIKCGLCVNVCPLNVLCMGEDGPMAISPQSCMECGQCVAICPRRAIDNIKTPLANQSVINDSLFINSETAEQFLRLRRSIRCYKNKAVPRDQLEKLVDIARFAPTASNRQDVSYIIVENKEIIKKATEITIEWMESEIKNSSSHYSFPYHVHAYRETGTDTILRDCPYLILATTPKGLKNGRENTMLSLDYLTLFATTFGLGTCWAGVFEMCAFVNDSPLLKLFNISDDKIITGAVMIGYPKYSYKRMVDRRPLDVTWIE